LFADSPATTTGGRYYFSPPDTPFLPTQHFYGSRRWYETNYAKIQGLGEDIDEQQIYYNGEPPAILPLPQQIGDNTCFNAGDSIDRHVETDAMVNGFLRTCFATVPAVDPLWDYVSSFEICSIQYFYATIIKWSYEGEFARIATAFRMLLGNAIQINSVAGAGVFPNVHVVQRPEFAVVVVDGTPNNQTLAMQAFAGIVPPLDYGILSTYPLWYAVGQYVHNIVVACGVTKDQKVMFAGHSMGSVSLDTLAARYKFANPDRTIRMISFGSPKPGDVRLKNLLRKCPNISIVNEQDIVGSLPPDKFILYPVALAFPLYGLFVWDEWIKEPNRARMDINGKIALNVDPLIDTPLLTHLLEQIIALQPFEIVAPHFIEEYRRRIDVRCPDESWPLDDPTWDYLHERNFAFDAGIGIGAAVPEIPGRCFCCGESPVPAAFAVEMHTTAFPELDGMIITLFLGDFGPPCNWFGEGGDGSIVLQVQDWNPDLGFPVFLSLDWIGSPYGDIRCENEVPAANFHCSPWSMDVTFTVTLDNEPTTDEIRFVIVGVPPVVESFDAGIGLGAMLDESSPEVALAGVGVGAQLVEPTPPVEQLQGGIGIAGDALGLDLLNAGIGVGAQLGT